MPKPLRIAHIIHSGAIGGGPRVVLEIASRAAAEHTIMAPSDGPLLSDAKERGIGTMELGWAGKYSFALSIPWLVKQFSAYDLVHLHGQFAGFYGATASRVARKPSIYTAHFPSFLTDVSWQTKLRNRAAELLTCRLASLTVACSYDNQREYVRRRLVDPRKIVTIQNGISIPKPARATEDIRKELDLDHDSPVILAVGRLTEQKGFDLLLKAAQIVVSEIPSAKFVVVGDGYLRQQLEDQAQAAGLARSVLFTGFRTDVEDLLPAATLVAAPSRYESSGVSVLEAMMASRPVVATDLPVFGETVRDGETGLLVPFSASALAQGVLTLVKDRELRQSMGRKARERADKHFGADAMAAAYTVQYQRLASA